MTDKEYDKLKPGDIVIETRTGKEWKFVKECIVILDPMELQLKGFDNLYNGVRQCEKYAVIEDTNKIRTQIPLYNFINKYTIKEMENEIKIKVPEGKKAVQDVDSNGNIVIKFENIEPIRSKSWEEFCKKHSVVENEWFISSNARIMGRPIPININRDVVYDANFLETKEDAEGILALIKLTRLHDEWVSGWNPQWGWEAGEMKYFIGPEGYKRVVIDKCCCYPRLLVFPTKEMAEEFLNCFRDLIETAIKFI